MSPIKELSWQIKKTCWVMKEDKQRCLEARMDDYVAKPLKPSELFSPIDRGTKENKN